MGHIPTELLHEIFIKLDLKYKLECMLVCRLWYDTLDRRSLLDTLSVRSGVFLKLKKMIEHHPYRAKQVEILKLSADFDKRILCNMFPNLREFVNYNSFATEKTNYLDSPFEFTHATSKLEKIVDSGECELTRQLAMSNMCTSLKSLELSFLNLLGFLGSDILSQLKNMPALDMLTLDSFVLKLMDLEMVHCNIPSIKHLFLRNARIVSGRVSNGVIPAMLITNFDMKLIDVADLHTHIELYKYLAKKYPSVTKPTFDDYIIRHESSNYVKEVYNEGIIPCYQKIGSLIDTFSSGNYCDGLDAFRKFDDSGIKLKHLDLKSLAYRDRLFVHELVESQQAKYIQNIIVKGPIPGSLEMLINMEALTSLELNFLITLNEGAYETKGTVPFSYLIEACPATLTDLIIEGADLTFDESTSNITSIQNLKLKDVDIRETATITGTSFPELSVFYLDTVITHHLTILLPDHHLKKVTIEIECPKGDDCGLSVNTMYYGKPQRSIIHPDPNHGCGGKIYCSDKSTYESIGAMVDLTCGSIEKLSYSINEIVYTDDDDYSYGFY